MLDFDKKWRDHSTVFFKSVPLVKSSLESFRWERPKVVVIKINYDAAVGRHFSSIATIARDWRGNMFFALSRKVNTIIPLQAEAEAILWAGQLAVLHGFPTVVIESNCKECVQTGNRVDLCPWQIQSLVLEFLDAMGSLHCWSLHWVRRDANRASHALAQWSLHSSSCGPLNFCNAPQAFVSICNLDLSGSSL